MSTRKAQIIRQEQELTAQAQVQERERQRQAINKKLDQLFCELTVIAGVLFVVRWAAGSDFEEIILMTLLYKFCKNYF